VVVVVVVVVTGPVSVTEIAATVVLVLKRRLVVHRARAVL